jgi:two-component system phosphate regulon sensor histidine kinase PhoR
MFRRLYPPFLVLLVLVGCGLAWGVAAEADEPQLRRRLLAWVAAGTASAALGVAVLSRRAADRLNAELDDLLHAAERMGDDSRPPRVPVLAHDEVATLGRVFNRTSDRLAARIAELEEDRHQLRTILSGMVEGVVALDADQRILFANERASQLLELHAPPPVGRRLWEVVRQRALLDVVQRALDRPEPSREEINWTGATARSLTVHAARLPGAPSRGAVLVLHDTSELRRLERLRQEFVANVSHELKTPLSVIKACVETLLDGAVEDAGHRGLFLERIAEQSDRLHLLILDLLSLARIESGTEMFEFRAVPVEPVIRACVERHRTRAEARRQTLVVANDEGDAAGTRPADDSSNGAATATAAAVAVYADEEALDQILDNLVDNAVKYTPEGGCIRVGWSLDGGQVCLQVADNGIGIPDQDLPRIFERFYRVDKARSREMGGTGLGLSIVKHLAQAMHGSVRAASTVGQGTTFTICLPQASN